VENQLYHKGLKTEGLKTGILFLDYCSTGQCAVRAVTAGPRWSTNNLPAERPYQAACGCYKWSRRGGSGMNGIFLGIFL